MSTKDRLVCVWLGIVARQRANEERGATLPEYALLVALIAVVCAASLDRLSSVASEQLSQVGASVGQP